MTTATTVPVIAQTKKIIKAAEKAATEKAAADKIAVEDSKADDDRRVAIQKL